MPFILSTPTLAPIPTKQRPYAFWGLPALAFALHGWQRKPDSMIFLEYFLTIHLTRNFAVGYASRTFQPLGMRCIPYTMVVLRLIGKLILGN